MNAKFEISQCSSCGEDHKEVEAFHVHAKHFDWLAVCPMTLMPVYIATRPAEDDDRRRLEAMVWQARATETQVQIIDNLPVNEQVVFWRAVVALAEKEAANKALSESLRHEVALQLKVARTEALLEKAWDAALQSAGFIRASDTAFPRWREYALAERDRTP